MKFLSKNNQVILIDKKDYPLVAGYSWFVVKYGPNGKFKASSNKRGKKFFMHRLIMNAMSNQQVDHINGNTLDNRRENLRLCSSYENMMNRGKMKNNTSGYKGVSWNKNLKKWVTAIKVYGRRIHLGYFKNIHKAAKTYNEASKRYHKEFSYSEGQVL